jgi:hypothetical protein
MLAEVHVERVECAGVIESHSSQRIHPIRKLFQSGTKEERAMGPHKMQDHLISLLH